MTTIRHYVAAFNANDVAALDRLIADDICIIDSNGDGLQGRARVLEARRRFIAIAPDYRIEVSDMSARGSQVFLRGRTTCADDRLTGEVLWRALVEQGRVREWQSYSPAGTPNLTRILMPELFQPEERRTG